MMGYFWLLLAIFILGIRGWKKIYQKDVESVQASQKRC